MKIDFREFISTNWVNRYKNYLPKANELWTSNTSESTQFGVDKTTARAICTGERGKNGPLAIYNVWAARQYTAMTTDQNLSARLRCQSTFDEWHASVTYSLVQEWNIATGGSYGLSIAHRYKLVDLFVRWIRVKRLENEALAIACLNFGHIPLDRKSLHVLSETFGGVGLKGPFSMGNIHTEGAYRFYQRLAQYICTEAGGSPLLFDVFCLHHLKAQALYK